MKRNYVVATILGRLTGTVLLFGVYFIIYAAACAILGIALDIPLGLVIAGFCSVWDLIRGIIKTQSNDNKH